MSVDVDGEGAADGDGVGLWRAADAAEEDEDDLLDPGPPSPIPNAGRKRGMRRNFLSATIYPGRLQSTVVRRIAAAVGVGHGNELLA